MKTSDKESKNSAIGPPFHRSISRENLSEAVTSFCKCTRVEREGGENTENKEGMKKNWKENYVPYDDNKEEGGDNKDKKEVEKVAEEDADEEEERHGDEKDSYEKEVDGKEKL